MGRTSVRPLAPPARTRESAPGIPSNVTSSAASRSRSGGLRSVANVATPSAAARSGYWTESTPRRAWPSWSAAARGREPRRVHEGGHGLAEGVGGHPVEAGGGEGLAKVGLGVGGVSPAAQRRRERPVGCHGPRPVASMRRRARAASHAPAGEYESAGACVGLLDFTQALSSNADRGRPDLDRADSRSTAFQARPQASPIRSPVAIRKPTIGRVPGDRLLVVGECGPQLRQLRQGQRGESRNA